MDELKACPFCGSEKVTLFYDECQNYHVNCYGCNKTVSFHITENSSWVKAIEIYNRRAEPENKPLTLEELRERVGKPVWATHEDESGGRWGIVDVNKFGICANVDADSAYWFDDECKNIAYDHPPKEDKP